MASSTRFDPAKHPRGPLGRFIDTDQLTPSGRRNERLYGSQVAMRSNVENLGEAATVENLYSRGKLFTGTPMSKLSTEQKAAVEEYLYASDLNADLRTGSSLRPDDAATVAQLDSVVESNQLAKDTVVYRGVADPANGGPLFGVQPGDQLVDHGFSSTSLNPSISMDFGDDLLEIELPAGTHAAPISKVNSYEYGPQSEVLVGRGAVLEIDSIESMEDTGYRPTFGSRRRLVRARLVGYVEDKPPGAAKFGSKKTEHVGATSITTRERGDSGALEIVDVQTGSASRGQGSARAAMTQVLNQADRDGKTVQLVPEPQDGQTSKRKLQEFYRSLGFVPNTGPNRRRDIGTHYWIRPPGGRS